MLACLSSKGRIRVWNLKSRSVVGELHVAKATELTFPLNDCLVVRTQGAMKSWRFGGTSSKLTHLQRGFAYVLHSRGRILVSHNWDLDEVSVIDVVTGRKLGKAVGSEVRNATISATGKSIVIAGEDGKARLRELSDFGNVRELSHQGPVTCAAFSSSGRYLATLSEDQFTRVWDARDGNEIGRFRQEGGAQSVMFSPNDAILCVASIRTVHSFKFDPSSGLLPLASRQLRGTWIDQFQFEDDQATSMRVLTQIAYHNWRVETVRFEDVEANPVAGNVDALEATWSLRTGLQYEGQEDVVPIFVVRASAA